VCDVGRIKDGTGLSTDNPPLYAEYTVAIRSLVELAQLAYSSRELDRYLWIGACSGRGQGTRTRPST